MSRERVIDGFVLAISIGRHCAPIVEMDETRPTE
jgi:hypothetical protein